MFNLDLIHNMC